MFTLNILNCGILSGEWMTFWAVFPGFSIVRGGTRSRLTLSLWGKIKLALILTLEGCGQQFPRQSGPEFGGNHGFIQGGHILPLCHTPFTSYPDRQAPFGVVDGRAKGSLQHHMSYLDAQGLH